MLKVALAMAILNCTQRSLPRIFIHWITRCIGGRLYTKWRKQTAKPPSLCSIKVQELENNKNFLQKYLRCKDGIKSAETSCCTARQHLAMGHTCKSVAPYPYIWQLNLPWLQSLSSCMNMKFTVTHASRPSIAICCLHEIVWTAAVVKYFDPL